MTAFGVIPEHDCDLCGDTGWITCVDIDGESAYEMPCPEGCPTTGQPAEWDQEAPF